MRLCLDGPSLTTVRNGREHQSFNETVFVLLDIAMFCQILSLFMATHLRTLHLFFSQLLVPSVAGPNEIVIKPPVLLIDH